MSILTIRIPTDLERKLQRLCKRQHRSSSDVVRESLRRYVVAEQLRESRAKLRPYAERAGFFTDEDVFKAVS
jgi:predicted transcriptional regulator